MGFLSQKKKGKMLCVLSPWKHVRIAWACFDGLYAKYGFLTSLLEMLIQDGRLRQNHLYF